MGKLMQNTQSLVVEQILETVRAALTTKLDAVVNLAYRQGFQDGLTEGREVKS